MQAKANTAIIILISKNFDKLTVFYWKGGISMNKQRTGYPSIDQTHLEGIPKSKLHPKTISITMLALFRIVNAGHMNEIAISGSFDNKVHTKRQLYEDSLRFAAKLLSITKDVEVSDPKIAIVAPNCYEGIVAMIGANAVGIGVALIEPSALYYENRGMLIAELNVHQPLALIAYGEDVNWVNEVKNDNRLEFLLSTVWMIEPYNLVIEHEIGFWTNILSDEPVDSSTRRKILSYAFRAKDRPMLYLKTSGSTSGVPKTLPFSNRAIYAALIYASNSTGMKTRDPRVGRVLCNAPYQHGYGWMTMFMHLLGGMQIVLVGGGKDDIARYHCMKPSVIYGTPLTLKQFIESTPDGYDLSSLTAFYCAGDAISEEEYDAGIKFLREHNSTAEIRNNYGISEALCVGTATDGITHVPGTIGKFYLGPDLLIVDENLKEVKYNEQGELLIAADTLCKGYFGDKKATKASFFKRSGKVWFKTGDIMSLREDGYVKFYDRKRRFFFAKGVTDKVNCETIEQAIDSLSTVDQSAVIVKKYDGTDGAKAFVVLRGGESGTDQAEIIRQDLKAKLLDFQMPQEIIIVDEIPIMPSGKINYQALEQM